MPAEKIITVNFFHLLFLILINTFKLSLLYFNFGGNNIMYLVLLAFSVILFASSQAGNNFTSICLL